MTPALQAASSICSAAEPVFDPTTDNLVMKRSLVGTGLPIRKVRKIYVVPNENRTCPTYPQE